MAFVGAGAAVGGGGSSALVATPPLPSSALLQDGDLLVAVIWWAHRNTTSGAITAGSGMGAWSLMTSNNLNLAGANDGLLQTVRAVYATGMATPEWLCWGGAGAPSAYLARVLAFRDVDVSDPLMGHTAVSVSAADATGAVISSQVPSATGAMELGIAVKFAQASGLGVGGSGWSLIGTSITSAGDDAALGVLQRTLASTSPTGDSALNFGTPLAYVAGKGVLLRPATPGLTIFPTFIDSAEEFWAPVVTNASDQVVSPSFIASAEEFYPATVYLAGITPVFIDSAEEFYTATVTAVTSEGEVVEPVYLQRFNADEFPPGTVVSIHEAHKGWADRAPIGTMLSQATVSALGVFEASGLVDGRFYVAYGYVDGKHRYLRFRYEASTS